MKSNKIILVFTLMIVAMIGGYFVYNHNQKVNLAQYYYDSGDYKKASDLQVGDISDKSGTLNSAKLWRMDLDNDFMRLFMTIQYIGKEIEENQNDEVYVKKLKVYYREIAKYFNISEEQLDKICKIENIESGANKLKNLNLH